MKSIHTPPDFDVLVRLLDDPSPTVRVALVEAFRGLGPEETERLRALSRERRPEAAHALAILRALGDDNAGDEFLRHMRGDDPDLERACLLIEKKFNKAASADSISEPLDEMAGRVSELIDGVMSPRELCRAVGRVIYHERGFRGDRSLFLNPAGSLLGRVLKTRRGIPLSLCLLQLLVSRRCGVPVLPVGLPGRFMLGCGLGGAEGFFIDCHDGGVFRNADEVRLILRRNGLPSDAEYFRPVDTTETICRFCRNLSAQCEASGDLARARLFSGFVRTLEKKSENENHDA